MQPSTMPDDSAHGTNLSAPDPKIHSPAFEPDAEAQAQMKVQKDLEGAVSPLDPALNPPQRHCDPHRYRYATLGQYVMNCLKCHMHE